MPIDPVRTALGQMFGPKPNPHSADARLRAAITPPVNPWMRALAGQGSISSASNTLTQRMENGMAGGLNRLGVNQRYSNHVANRAVGALNDLTPVGNVTGAVEGGQQFGRGVTRGDLRQAAIGAGVFGLSMLPFAGAAKRPAGRILGDLMHDEAGAIRAWHGSPHDFDKFDINMLGTGEGNQAYGRGLYFADRPGVAGSYVQPRGAEPRDVAPEITDNLRQLLKADDYLGFDTFGQAIHAVRTNPTDFHRAWEISNPDAVREAMRAYEAAKWPAGKKPTLYEVDINANPEDFVNHDLTPNAERVAKDRGAAGIKFLDGNSRHRGGGSNNYVVFDPSLIDIRNKY